MTSTIKGSMTDY